MPDYYNYNYGYNGGGRPPRRKDDFASWLPVILGLVIFWPVGLVLLFRKLMGYSNGSTRKYRASGADYYRAQADYARRQGAPYQQTNAAPKGQTGQTQNAKSQPRNATAQPAGAAQGFHHYTPMSKAEIKRRARDEKRMGFKGGKGLIIGGSILAGFFGLGSLSILVDGMSYGWWSNAIFGFLTCLGFCGLGAVMAFAGISRGRSAKRYRRYLGYIGRRESLSLSSLSEAMGVPYSKVCADLQDMLDRGILPPGYVDHQEGRLILSEEGLFERAPAPKKKAEKTESKSSSDDEILMEIRRIDDLIPDPVISAKINRIGVITGKILDYQRQNPTKADGLRQFLNYYLPTTLKILRAYARLDAQGVEGENITAAKARIEGMMDKVVEGFEKQLDRLFQNDAMDITTDVAVLEQMIERDGLTGGSAASSPFGF